MLWQHPTRRSLSHRASIATEGLTTVITDIKDKALLHPVLLLCGLKADSSYISVCLPSCAENNQAYESMKSQI